MILSVICVFIVFGNCVVMVCDGKGLIWMIVSFLLMDCCYVCLRMVMLLCLLWWCGNWLRVCGVGCCGVLLIMVLSRYCSGFRFVVMVV